jgi:hypothetical protein
MGEMRSTNKIEKPEEHRQFGRFRRTWGEKVKIIN